MTENLADQLAVLVRDRAEGRLSVADYRRLRAPLLDRLVTQVASAIDEASVATRPRVVSRAPEPERSRATSDLERVFAPPSRMGLWALGVLASGAILAMGWKHERASPAVSEDEIALVQVTTRPVTSEPSRDSKARVISPKERSLLQPPAIEVGPRIIMLPPQSSGVVLGVSARAITQSQFRTYCEKTGHSFPRQPWEGGDPAVANVTWDEANDYARWLSRQTGQRYRLPTESEWLHAAQTLGARNGFTAGKVREWVADEWEGGQRVVRGSSYADEAASLLSARRNLPQTIRDALTGFRVVRETTP